MTTKRDVQVKETGINGGRFLNVYILTALLICAGLLAAELSMKNLDLARTVYTIWVTTLLLAPALGFFLFRHATRAAYEYWILYWTFAYLAYLVHFYWAVFVIFGSPAQAFIGQGAFIASTNFLLTFLWGVDVVLAQIIRGEPKWLLTIRIAAHLLVFVAFAATALFLKDGVIRIIGGFMTGTVLLCALVRLLAWERVAPTPGEIQAQT